MSLALIEQGFFYLRCSLYKTNVSSYTFRKE
nr:MAG TPA: hypothetical protein [Caudoviricetes sp.]